MTSKNSVSARIIQLTILFIFPIIVAFIYFTNTTNWKYEKKKSQTAFNEREDEKTESGYALEAAKWYYQQRAYPYGKIPNNWREEAYKHIAMYNQPKLLEKTSSANSLSWSQLGPGNIGGRVRAIVVSPTDPNTVYIGSVSGGVWKTTNGGTSWFPLGNGMSDLAVCSLVIDPKNPNIIYAGTGEGFANYDAIQGAGIFKSTDSGLTWGQLSSTADSNFYFVNRLVIDSTNGNIFASTRYGLFMSTDGGNTFMQKVSFAQIGNTGACLDVAISYTKPTTIYATFGEFLQSQIWRSIDGGSTFHFNYKTPGTGRIELATSQSNPQVAYASFMDIYSYEIFYIKETMDGGNTWADDSVPQNSSEGPVTYTANQGWYNNAVTVDPDSASNLLVAGIDTWKSTNNGIAWVQKTNAYDPSSLLPNVHSDIHTLVYAPSNHNVIYLGCDGGVFVSNDRGNTWRAINNNLFITQFYSCAVTPTGSTYYGGTQDNYTLKSSGSTNWYQILPGDGGVVNVDYNNTRNVYGEFPFFTFVKSTDGGSSFNYAMDGIPQLNPYQVSDRTSFVTPVAMDPNNPNILAAGTFLVYITTDGAKSWQGITLDLTGDGPGNFGNYITAITIAKGNSNVIYAGCSNGKIWVTQNASAGINSNWTEIDKTLPYAWCTSLTTEPDNAGIIYATFSGYLTGSKVYKSTDFGKSWTNISGDLPNIPVTSLVVNPNNVQNLFIGTDLGIFSTTDSGVNWVVDGSGMSNVPVSDLRYRASDNKIFAATHGRGLFSAVIPGATGVDNANTKLPASFELSQNYPNPFNPSTNIQYSLPESRNIRMVIYDISGKEIKTLVNSFEEAGQHNITWDGTNNKNLKVSSGVYFYTLSAGNLNLTKKLILLK